MLEYMEKMVNFGIVVVCLLECCYICRYWTPLQVESFYQLPDSCMQYLNSVISFVNRKIRWIEFKSICFHL